MMSNSLLDDILIMDTQLDLVIGGDENRNVIEKYEQISSSLTPSENILSSLIPHQEALVNILDIGKGKLPEDVYTELKVQFDSTKFIFNNLMEAWITEDYLISQNSLLGDTKESIRTLNKLLTEFHQAVWDIWVNEQRNNFHEPEELIETQKDIPHLSDIYQNYTSTLSKFNLSAKELPQSKGVLDTMLVDTKELSELRKQMEFDLPPEVQSFFKELNQGFGSSKSAPLKMMTKDVMKWLIESNEISNFIIKRK